MFKHILIVFLVSMVPLIELRGAIPYGVLYGLPLWLTFLVAIMGNMLPVPVIYFLARKVLVRNYSQNPRLPGGLRISVGTAAENPLIIEAIRDIIL